MADMYTGGSTLTEIGETFGVSRERVRQILKRQGTVTADNARRVRREARADKLAAAARHFLGEYSEVVSELAASGVSRTEIEARFSLLVPSVPATIVRDALDRCEAIFNVEVQEVKFSKAVIRGAVWFALARERRLPAEPVIALRHLNVATAAELVQTLGSEGLDGAVIAEILISIEAARVYAATNSGIGLSAQRYDAQRRKALTELGFRTGHGTSPWPPTSQTVSKRLGAGAWADALTEMGLTPDKRGRQRGLLVFTEAQYVQAVSDFLDFVGQTAQPQTYVMYGKWVERESEAGRHRPAPASVRLQFGNWANARRRATTQ